MLAKKIRQILIDKEIKIDTYFIFIILKLYFLDIRCILC